jgi:transcription elongation GreA/GreB family factor
LETTDEEQSYLIGPKAGGTEIVHSGVSITVITPTSPIGRHLMGKKAGECIVLHGKKLQVLRIC